MAAVSLFLRMYAVIFVTWTWTWTWTWTLRTWLQVWRIVEKLLASFFYRTRCISMVIAWRCYIVGAASIRLYRSTLLMACFWIIFVIPSSALNRHGRTWVILSRLHCTMYTHNMAAAALNIDLLSNDVVVTVSILVIIMLFFIFNNKNSNANNRYLNLDDFLVCLVCKLNRDRLQFNI